jgi:pseudaminic acid cytidylyltransferase
MSKVALIPARGGSKRLPRKNILELAGKPVLAYPIDAALATGMFDEIYVSTEDQEIARVALCLGAKVIDRPPEISGDRSTVAQVCLHALETLSGVDIFCCIYATAVFLKPSTILESHKLLYHKAGADFVMGVSKYEYSPVQALKENEHGFLSYMWPNWQGIQSQFYPHLVVSNGTFYWGRREAFLKEKTFYGNRLRGFIVPSCQVSDIDTPKDFEKVRKFLHFKNQR